RSTSRPLTASSATCPRPSTSPATSSPTPPARPTSSGWCARTTTGSRGRVRDTCLGERRRRRPCEGHGRRAPPTSQGRGGRLLVGPAPLGFRLQARLERGPPVLVEHTAQVAADLAVQPLPRDPDAPGVGRSAGGPA